VHLLKASINGNPNVGLYLYLTDEFCIAGLEVDSKTIEQIHKVVKVPVYHLNICGTSLVGAFCAGNSECLLLPEIVLKSELEQLESFNIKYKILKTDLNALGNNILANEIGCLVNPDFSAAQQKEIRTALQVNLIPGRIADLPTVGGLAVLNSSHGVVHHDISPAEKRVLKELFEIKIESATVNLGNPYVRSGLVSNKHGFIIGSQSTGVEISHIDEELGFLH
jgi:translation initiation factor 6